MSQSNTTKAAARRLATFERAAEHAGKTPRTIGRWVDKGLLPGFKIGPNRFAVDLNDVDQILRTHSTVKAQRFGPDAKIVDVSNVVLAVEGLDQ